MTMESSAGAGGSWASDPAEYNNPLKTADIMIETASAAMARPALNGGLSSTQLLDAPSECLPLIDLPVTHLPKLVSA